MTTHHSKGSLPLLNAISLQTATKRGAAWTKEEDDLLRSVDSRNTELLAAAQLMHRTLVATIVRYYKIRTADAEGRQITYNRDWSINYPDTKTRTRIYQAPACACADPWDHRPWCPDRPITEGEHHVPVHS